MQDHFETLLKQLHEARCDAAKAKDEMNAILAKAQEDADYQRAAIMRDAADKDIETLTEQVHALGREFYAATGEKTINPYIKVREENIFTITDADAMKKFVETRLPDALVVDEKKVKQYALKVGPVDGTTVTKEPKITIASDLSEVGIMTKFTHIRNLTHFEKEVLRYIVEHPGCNTEQVCNVFEEYQVERERTASACGYLFSDFWVSRDPATEALTAIEEVPA